MTRWGWRAGGVALACLVPALLVPERAVAQSGKLPIEFGGLLRVGFRAEPGSSEEADGFDVFDARARAEGQVGLVFDYMMQAEYDPDEEVFRLLDATLTVPLLPELDLSFGLFRPAFGLEALEDRGDLAFLERAQATEAIAPGRQVGVSIDGDTFDGRLTYGAGLFNGNGDTLDNDGDNFMFSGRLQFNSIGTIAFYEDFVVQVGASIARSSDTAAELGDGIVTGDPAEAPEFTAGFAGDRTLYGMDIRLTYREWSITGEFLHGDYDVAPDPGDPSISDFDAQGGYVEIGYRAYGLIEGVVRYDSFDPVVGTDRQFGVIGLNIYPGLYTKLGLQYAIDLDDSPNASTLAGNQFIFVAQVEF